MSDLKDGDRVRIVGGYGGRKPVGQCGTVITPPEGTVVPERHAFVSLDISPLDPSLDGWLWAIPRTSWLEKI